MPIYQYRCNNCGSIEDLFLNMVENHPTTTTCLKCHGIAVKMLSVPNVNVGIKKRVYYQWKGDPAKCPPDLRDALRNQDIPKGISEFSKEGEPVLGTGSKFVPKR